MKKEIEYTIKITTANTDYTMIDDNDKTFIMRTLIKILASISEADNNKDMKDITSIFHAKSTKLPRSKNGQNSIASFIGGLVNNIHFGTQRDYTTIQLSAIQQITGAINEIFTNIPQLEFYCKE